MTDCERCRGYGEHWFPRLRPEWLAGHPWDDIVRPCGLCLGDGIGREIGVAG